VLDRLVGDGRDAGAGLGHAVADGIRSSIGDAVAAALELAQAVRDALPGSDAKVGPLSDLTASGRALPETLIKGMLAGSRALSQTMMGMLTPMPAGGGAGQEAATLRQAHGAQQNITVNIHNPLGEPAETSMVRQLRNMAYLGMLG